MHKIILTPKQFEQLVSGDPLDLKINEDLVISLTVGDLAAVRLFKLMRETIHVVVSDVVAGDEPGGSRADVWTLANLVRESLENALENGYYNGLKLMTTKQVADDLYAQSADIEAWVDANSSSDLDGFLEREVVPIVTAWFNEKEGNTANG